MIAVVQRVSGASVTIDDDDYHAAIGPGLCVLLGVQQQDSEQEAEWIAGKIARLRIFRDDEGKMNRSVQDIDGEILLISQFTLVGDCRKGNRPSFIDAAEPKLGEKLYEFVGQQLAEIHQLPVKTGKFGTMMQINLVNEGPVTLIIERQPVS